MIHFITSTSTSTNNSSSLTNNTNSFCYVNKYLEV